MTKIGLGPSLVVNVRPRLSKILYFLRKTVHLLTDLQTLFIYRARALVLVNNYSS